MIDVQLQQDYTNVALPITDALVNRIANAVMSFFEENAYEMGIACVGETTSHKLNLSYRNKDKPTNVLSFESQMDEALCQAIGSHPLGDLVICIPVVLQEAVAQNKTPLHHFSHLVVHGMLHLLGYDHETSEEDAEQMEALEIEILSTLGIKNPYEDVEI